MDFGVIFQSIGIIFEPYLWLLMLGGVFGGIVIGAIPGLTATMALVLLVPVTYAMDITSAVCLLISVYVGGIAGGFISAVLIGIPGTPSSVASTFDGYPMVKNGEHERALGIGAWASTLAGLLGGLILILFSPILANIALKFGPFEYLALIIFTFTTIASFSTGSLVKGFIGGMIGLLAATVGSSSIAGIERFNFGSPILAVGFSSMPALIGMYAIPEILNQMENFGEGKIEKINLSVSPKAMMKTITEFGSMIKGFLISTFWGTIIGILPGIGPGLSNIVAYSKTKEGSKKPELFGKGSPEGIMASETGKQAATGGALIPMLSLGIPGDSSTLVLIGAFMLQGLNPGPLLYKTSMDVVSSVFISFIISNILMLVCLIFLMVVVIKVLSVPTEYLYPIIVVFCVTGSFALNSNMFDVVTFLLFGLLGYVFNKLNIATLPVVIGLMLGGMAENQLSIAMSFSGGSLLPLFTRPISLVLLIVSALSLLRTIKVSKKNEKEVA